MTSFRGDERGSIAVNIVFFVATIVFGFMLYAVFQPAAMPMLDAAATHTSTEAAANGQSYIRAAWNNSHLFVILVGALQLVVAAVARRQGVI